MARLFGTDGIRGIANEELTCEQAAAVGRAAAYVLNKLSEEKGKRPKIIIGTDTRLSCDMLQSALAAGLCSAGADVLLAGVIPTPAIAYLTQLYGCNAGAVISASHNPYDSNGIKFFNSEGYKLSDEIEDEIEKESNTPVDKTVRAKPDAIGRIEYENNSAEDYIKRIISTCKIDFAGRRIALDCANGAASVIAPVLFKRLGAKCYVINNSPDGMNINDRCGSQHPEQLIQTVKENRCAIGFAFDGDADRCIAVDERGEIIDGDRIIAAFALYFKNLGRLAHNTAVVTSMTNMGFFRMAESNGINTAVTRVGDRYVLEEMLKNGYVLGGEQSGHILLLEHSTTGDGILTAVQMLEMLVETGEKASALVERMKTYPQVLINVKVANSNKEKILPDTEIAEAVKNAENVLGNDGRIIIRPSGTEPLVRVMVEGIDFAVINKLATDISNLIGSKYEA